MESLSSMPETTITLSTGPTIAYTLSVPPSPPSKVAIVAHPLGRLGGCKEDHVVQSIARLLRNEGWAVCTYDARGAGESGGSASWTGLSEAEDFKEIVEKILLPLTTDATIATIDLLLCGYSFGSLAASSFHSSALSTFHSITIRSHYLLISYPLSVLWALTIFHSATFQHSLESIVRENHPVLAIYGTQDQFSGVDKLRKWREGLETMGMDRFVAVEVAGADHFWRDRDAKVKLLESVQSWLRKG